METNILLLILVALSAITTISQIILILQSDHPHESRPTDLWENQKKIMAKTEETSNRILGNASTKAQKIIANAELRGIKLFAREKLDSAQIVQDYAKQVSIIKTSLEEDITQITQQTEKTYQDYISNLEKLLFTHASKNEAMLLDKSNQLINTAQKELDNFIDAIHENIKNQIDRELAAVKTEISEYKKHRLNLVETNIIDIIEKTIQKTLGKKLDMRDQTDVIYKALEEAKLEHTVETNE